MSLSESKFMLQDSKQLLNEINQSYEKYLSEEYIPRELQNKIRNFLNNIESALDYAAFDIFSRFCIKNVPQEKLSTYEKRINFPLRHSKKEFDKYIDTWFLGLRTERPDIVFSFEKHQPFMSGGSNWLTRFNFLVNNNKHRKLSKQKRTESREVRLVGQHGSNIVMIDCQMDSIGIDGQSIRFDQRTQLPINAQSLKSAEATIWVDFIFQDIQQSVLATLDYIYDGATYVINDLEQII
ncbi:hypothetical protein NKR74_14780 [Bacillus sp. 3103sda1]|uniref:hypothetical protein n=1 Tax=Bacillus sp. 3103sda1 TaxID=2953808 RepID=UPI0020A11E68|nr:hypothetical protein [Bacillus sp. 3103sda1]MCP1124553.1 hypothetical protein [Bacillus sp. 3103sda1]